MKKILAFVLTLSLLTTFFAVPAFAQGGGSYNELSDYKNPYNIKILYDGATLTIYEQNDGGIRDGGIRII